jgi:hypothetical protein
VRDPAFQDAEQRGDLAADADRIRSGLVDMAVVERVQPGCPVRRQPERLPVGKRIPVRSEVAEEV